MKKLPQVKIARSGYTVESKQLSTVTAFKKELVRIGAADIRITADKDTPYRKIAAAMRVLQKLGISIGMVANVLEADAIPSLPSRRRRRQRISRATTKPDGFPPPRE